MADRRRDFPLYVAASLIVIAALALPDDLFASSVLLRSTVEFVTGFLPVIVSYSYVSPFPQLTQVLLTMSLLLSWVIALWYVYWQLKHPDYKRFRANHKLMAWGWVFGLMAAFPFYLPGPGIVTTYRAASLEYIAVQSKVGLALFASTWMCSEILFIVLFFVWLRALSMSGDD